MRFVIKSSCTSQDDTGNVAIVDFDDEALQNVVAWRELYETLRKSWSIVELPFFWAHCWWFDACPFGDADGLAETPFTEEQIEALEREEWVRVPDDFWLGEDEDVDEDEDESDGLKECRTSADQIVVGDRGVFCKAHVKYADSDDVETWVLPYDALICPIHGVDAALEKTCLRCCAQS